MAAVSVTPTVELDPFMASVTMMVFPAATVAPCWSWETEVLTCVPMLVGAMEPKIVKVLLVTDNAGLVTLAVRDLPVPD